MKTTTSQQSEPSFLRFGLLRRLEHHAGAILFTVLTLTGLAQRFHGAGWAQWVISTLGGIDATRWYHRWTGVLFAVLIAQHVVVATYGLIVKQWQPSMVVNAKDFQDLIVNLKYYFGLLDRPARCDRYDYRQKFEYWGVVLGGILMVVTGFMLWFPIVLFRWATFLPGELIPAAKTAHSNEAMLALLVIVVWHIYNSVFSPEVFPLDTAIFTGRLSRQRMIHEHPLEYERIMAAQAEESVPPVMDDAEPEIGDPEAAPERVARSG